MNRDSLRGHMSRIGNRIMMLEALDAALHVIEVLWYSMKVDQREKARKATGFDGWLKIISRAVDWQ